MTFNDQLLYWCKDNQDAYDFAIRLWEAAQEWDDLEDEGQCKHNALISWMAFGKEYTPFFAEHAAILRPLMLSMYLQWRAANTLDHGDWGDVCKSYMLRAAIYQIFHAIAWIVGGDDWAAEVGPDIYKSYGETPESLFKEFNNA